MRAMSLWAILAILALLLIVAGFQGSAGRMLAVVLTPARLQVIET